MIINSIKSKDYLNLSFREQFEYDLAQKDEAIQFQKESINIKDNVIILQKELISLKNEKAALENEFISLKKELNSLKDDIISLGDEAISIRDKTASMKNIICEKDKEIKRLKERLDFKE